MLFIIDKVDKVGLDSGGAKVQQAKLQQANNTTPLSRMDASLQLRVFPTKQGILRKVSSINGSQVEVEQMAVVCRMRCTVPARW